ncbi:hypothetical protein V2G26_007084 [Clonostachys chloroleuca]
MRGIKEKRLQFARLHIRKPLSWWKRVIFSDETTVARGQGERQNKLDKKYIQPKGKPTRHSQMFWGAFGWNIRISLVPLLGDPDSVRGGVTGRVIRD